MEIAAITRYKHGGIVRALRQLGWTQSELGRRAGLCPSRVGSYVNMLYRPSSEIADKIQAAFGKEGIYVDVLGAWPEDFKMKKAPVIVSYGEVAPHELPGSQPSLSYLEADQLEVALKSIPERLREILERHYVDGVTYDELAREHGVTRETVRKWVQRAERAARESYETLVRREEEGTVDAIPFIAPTCLPYDRKGLPGWAKEEVTA
tara:strand:- start:79 stop:699 length:621 start_codon:yes stop_codon:yes gene_type:complete